MRRNPKSTFALEASSIKDLAKGEGHLSTAMKLALSASIYYIWQERNRRVFEKEKGTA